MKLVNTEIDIKISVKKNISSKKIINILENSLLALKEYKKIENYNKFLSVSIIGKTKMKNLNYKYRGKNTVTDVLTFGDFKKNNSKIVNGDIYICYDVLIKQAKQYKNTMYKELEVLLTHAVLHLFGYDHKTKVDRLKMQNVEKKLLKKIGLVGR